MDSNIFEKANQIIKTCMDKVVGNIGDILTTKELAAMEISKDIIPQLIKNGKLERTNRGYCRMLSR